MKLTLYTDYAMRVMIHLAVVGDRLASIDEITRVYGVSRSHMMKVVQGLGAAGYVETVRGRNGGIRLGKPANTINIGELVRHTESSFQLVDCQNCLIGSACGLTGVLAEAMNAFLKVLDNYTIADLVGRQRKLKELFAITQKNQSRSIDIAPAE